MKSIPKSIRIDMDVYNTIKQNEEAIQENEGFSTLGQIYNMLLRLGIQGYLEHGNNLDLTPFLTEDMVNTTPQTEQPIKEEIEPEQRISKQDFYSLLKEGLNGSLEHLTTFHNLSSVKVLSLFNNHVEGLLKNRDLDMLSSSEQIEVFNFISFFVRGFAYLLYIYYPSQLDWVSWDILVQDVSIHPFLYIIDKTHHIDKDDIQMVLIKDLFKTFKDLELDIRLEISQEKEF